MLTKNYRQTTNDSAYPNGCLHNNCNVAPVRAFRRSPSKLQTRSKVQALLRVINIRCVSHYCYYRIRYSLRNHFLSLDSSTGFIFAAKKEVQNKFSKKYKKS